MKLRRPFPPWFHSKETDLVMTFRSFAETVGLFAAIGIKKGKKFAPDARMKAILTDAVAVGNATARAILFGSRDEAS